MDKDSNEIEKRETVPRRSTSKSLSGLKYILFGTKKKKKELNVLTILLYTVLRTFILHSLRLHNTFSTQRRFTTPTEINYQLLLQSFANFTLLTQLRKTR